jgi:hypothetical protein
MRLAACRLWLPFRDNPVVNIVGHAAFEVRSQFYSLSVAHPSDTASLSSLFPTSRH